jgi:hypothetical protein
VAPLEKITGLGNTVWLLSLESVNQYHNSIGEEMNVKRTGLMLLSALTVFALILTACGGGEEYLEEEKPQEVEPEDVETEPEEVEPAPEEVESAPEEVEEEELEGVEFALVNESGVDICHLYLSSADEEAWGPDQLGEDTVVRAGEEFTLEGIEPGTYDVRFEGCEGEYLERYGLDVTGTTVKYTLMAAEGDVEAGAEEAGGVALYVINDSSADICNLYLSSVDEEVWGPDQLAEDAVIYAGERLVLEEIEPGTYDVRFESCEGDYLERYGLDVTHDVEIALGD